MSSRPSRGAARLAAILDALPDALVLVNANGTVVNANTIALEAFEAPGTALVGRGLLDLLPQFDSRLIPGSMRRPDHMDPRGRTKPARMVARRTDGTEFPVEVTSANLENGQQAYDGYGYTGDELLMIVVRDLSGTVDTEAELARSQRQTEMILRAAAEGVVGTDTDGRIVLVNPAAAQILGYRAGELGGKELHTLVLHSRADGSPFPYAESPLADTLRSGRKHRVRGQVLWSKAGEQVSVDLTTAPVRDGDQLVGAVMTFTDRRPYDSLAEEKAALEKAHADELERLSEEHASDLTALRQQHVTEVEELDETHREELAAHEERYASLAEREKDRYDALAGRHEQLLTLLGQSLRGPLDELRRELSALASDDAGQLWPEANQVLHHLSAGYSRITTLIDNVLGYQRLDAGAEDITRTKVMLDAVVAAGVEGAVELIGPGRVQFAVHAPPIEAEVDPQRLATALAHLVADVAGVDATGNSPVSAGGYLDNTVVVAAAQRGEVARIEVRGPYAGGDPVHEPIVRGIVRAHGGVLQTHEVPGMSGSAYVLEVPLGGGAGAVPGGGTGTVAVQGQSQDGTGYAETPAMGTTAAEQGTGGGRRRARRASTDAFLESDVPGESDGSGSEAPTPTGRRRRRAGAAAEETGPGTDAEAATETPSGGTGRRRGRPAESNNPGNEHGSADGAAAEGAVVTAAEHAAGTAAVGTGLGGAVPPQGVPAPTGRRARRDSGAPQAALPPALPAVGDGRGDSGSGEPAPASGTTGAESEPDEDGRPTGRRRRALAAAAERAAAQEAGVGRTVFALPPAEADRSPESADAATDVTDVPGMAGVAAVAAEALPQAAGPVGPAQGALPGQAVQVPGQAVQVPAQMPVAVEHVPGDDGRHDAVPLNQAEEHTPPQPHPTSGPTGRRRRAVAQPAEPAQPVGPQPVAPQGLPAAVPAPTAATPAAAATAAAGQATPVPGIPAQGTAGQGIPVQAAVPPAVVPPAVVPPAAVPPVVVPAQGTLGEGVPVPPPATPAQAQQPQPQGPQSPQVPQVPQVPQIHATAAPVAQSTPAAGTPTAAQPLPAEAQAAQGAPTPPAGTPAATVPAQWPGADATPGAGTPVPATPAPGTPLPPARAAVQTPPGAQPLPAEAAGAGVFDPNSTQGRPFDPNSTQGRAFSVRTLGQGVPFVRQAAQAQQPTATPAPHAPGGSGRRRKLGTPPDPAARAEAQPQPEQEARPHPAAEQPSAQPPTQPAQPSLPGPTGTGQPLAGQSLAGQPLLAPGTEGAGRSYAIGAPDANAAEGPEPLDGPGGAVEVADPPRPRPMDDELPPEPLDNPRRLLVWPAPDVTTQQALSDRGYRPVIVHSREEVDAQIAAFPAALFVDPLTGPITRTALQSLRQAAVAAEVPVLVTAGLGQATREAAYGADPAVLLKALAPRDSEQHPPRVLLIEEHAEIALALTATLERRGMQVARAASDADAVTLAGQFRPNLVVMDLMRVHRQQAGIVDWLHANGQLNRTPLVVYTAAVDPADLPRLASGETVLFLAERSTSAEVQSRIVDLLARIGTN
ncbi:PAS domain-containing protein [Streptomyces sp. NK08204]|uniref:hybrid sensor histidine kinase/response regulator n=1 Tax=Streptomyces sp. NK08204 TaxID=2873260 RepID=UPI001CEC8E2A|nr:PAS domain-containing protein [Streptomyces sp. NK08204]